MKNIYLTFITLLMSCAAMAQAVVYDNNGTGVATSANTPVTLDIPNFSVPANSNRLLVVCAVNVANSQPPVVTYNGSTMTKAATRTTLGSGSRMTLYYLPLGSSASPTTSTVSALGSAVRNLIAGSFYNVNQTVPVDGQDSITFSSNAPTSFTQTRSIASRSADRVCDCIGAFAGSSPITSYSNDNGQTLIGQNVNTVSAGMSTKGGASSVPMSWTYNGNFSSSSNPDNTLRGSQVGINILSVSTVVPVGLYHFEAQNTEGGKNLLTWATASEVNNKHFDIERSTDGNTFQNIGQVRGNNKPSSYQYTDNQPFSTTYYRLKQVDDDGTATYSKVVSVTNKGDKVLKVYPTLVSNGILTVVIARDEATEGGDYAIYNIVGQQVQSGKIAQRLDVSGLAKGTYILKVGAEQAKFVKQ